MCLHLLVADAQCTLTLPADSIAAWQLPDTTPIPAVPKVVRIDSISTSAAVTVILRCKGSAAGKIIGMTECTMNLPLAGLGWKQIGVTTGKWVTARRGTTH